MVLQPIGGRMQMTPDSRNFACRRTLGERMLVRPAILFGVLTMALGACAGGPQETRPALTTSQLEEEAAPPGSPVRRAPSGPLSVVPMVEPVPERRIGTDIFVNQRAGAPRAPVPVDLSGDDELTVNMFDVPVRQAARAVLGETLGLDYAVTEGVDGSVTVQTSNPVSRSDLFEIFETVLEANGFSLSLQRGVYVVGPHAGDSGGLRLVRGPVTDGGVYVVPLRFISAYEMIRILSSITSSSLKLHASPTGNILFASGGPTDIEAVLDAVNLFDIDFMRGKSVSRVPLRVASPTEVAAELAAVFDTDQGGALEGVLRFLPNETLGSILIISSRAQYIADSERWIRSYDEAAGANRQVTIVYKLENRAAVELESVIAALLSGGAVAVAEEPGQAVPTAAADSGTNAELRINSAATGRVVADDAANALIAVATAREHEEIAKLIERLDSVAVQVLIEATIAEVTLNDDLDFGVRWFFEQGDFGAGFSALDVAGVGQVLPGFNAILDSNQLQIAISALESVTDINVVSSPTLLVLDNREAVLNVGDQVPIVTQQAVSVTDAEAPIVNSVEQRDTGVILTIRPRVSSGGRVILEIEQEVSDVVETVTSGIDSPTIEQRRISTTVAVDNGQSVALGGLIRERRVRTRSQVPILGDIPLLGALFRDVSDQDGRTELLVLITPRVISDSSQAQRVTEEYRSRLSRPSELANTARPTTKHRFLTILH